MLLKASLGGWDLLIQVSGSRDRRPGGSRGQKATPAQSGDRVFQGLLTSWLVAGGTMLKIGQISHDNDPRYRGRKIEVIRVTSVGSTGLHLQ